MFSQVKIYGEEPLLFYVVRVNKNNESANVYK
jgi:hypothetical protein